MANCGPGPQPKHAETELEVEFVDYEISDGYCQLQLQVISREGFGKVTVDWGDGTADEWATGMAWHNYRSVGRFSVRIGEEARWFRFWACYTVTAAGRTLTSRPQVWLGRWGDWLESAEGTFAGWSDPHHGGLKGRLPPWGASITNTECCYEYCTDVEGPFPKWTDAITNATGTYQHCELDGPLPRWGKNIEECGFCYYMCSKVRGGFPAWPEKCTYTNSCYYGCTLLEGEVPPWPRCASDIGYTYKDCPGLKGVIPAWPESVSDVNGCYRNCTGLTGAWTDDPTLLMPEEKVRYSPDSDYYRCRDTVTGCSDAVRSLFWDTPWGGTIPRPTPAPRGP